MWMNEHEIDNAASRYELHPVLGPATCTLVNLVRWTNANSDGWPYWTKPAKAADKLMQLIGTGIAYQVDPERQDATMEAYRAALTPLKSFRTRMGKTMQELFEIIDREGGKLWLAEQEYEQARKRYEQNAAYTETLRGLVREAGARVAELQQLEIARRVLAEMEATGTDTRLTELATPGTVIWLFPRTGEDGTGSAAGSLGMTGPTDRHLVVVKVPGLVNEPRAWLRLYPSVVHTLAEARRMWLVVDEGGTVVNYSRSWSRERAEELCAVNHPGCVVRLGSDVLPGALDTSQASPVS